MQKKKTGDAQDYASLLRQLKTDGPGRVYLLWGEEQYLRDDFLRNLRSLCVDGETDGFNYRKFDGASVTMEEIREAVNAMPFLGERTMVEVKDFAVNSLSESQSESFRHILEDIPDYCTLALLLPAGAEPDGRRATVRAVKKHGQSLSFTAQRQDQLMNWIFRRFAALGRQIDRSAAERLIFLSGSLMNGLIPEIEKAAAYAKEERVTQTEIDAVVTRLPEARVFEMTDCIAARDFNGAASAMAELLESREHPILLTAMLGQQMRRLYAARLALDQGRSAAELSAVLGITYEFITRKLLEAAKKFTRPGLTRGVELCAEADLAMKSTGTDDGDILRELLLKLSLEAV